MKPFPYMKLTVRFKDLEAEIYPYFLGSFIRGNFGMYLKKTVCPFGLRKPCDNCLIHKKCFYGEIFEPEKEASTSGRNIPHPFVLDTRDEEYVEGMKCTNLTFDILLFGPALKNFEFFILVFSEMGKNGIGKTRIKSREVIIEDHNGEPVYSSQTQRIERSPQVLTFEFDTHPPCERLKVTYTSPVRLKREGKWVGTPDFEILIRAALRRLLYLESFYGSAAGLPTKEIIESSTHIKNVSSDVQWVKRFRYSNRRKEKMNLSGIMGTQEFAGNILPLHLDLLRFVSIFHLGKSSSFGHGKIEVSI